MFLHIWINLVLPVLNMFLNCKKSLSEDLLEIAEIKWEPICATIIPPCFKLKLGGRISLGLILPDLTLPDLTWSDITWPSLAFMTWPDLAYLDEALLAHTWPDITKTALTLSGLSWPYQTFHTWTHLVWTNLRENDTLIMSLSILISLFSNCKKISWYVCFLLLDLLKHLDFLS